MLDGGESVPHGTALDASVVAHPLAHQHSPLVEETGIAAGIEAAARLAVADGVRLELRPLPLHVGRAAEVDGLRVARDHEQRVRDVLRDPVALKPHQRVDDRVVGREAARRPRRQAQATRRGRIEGPPLHRARVCLAPGRVGPQPRWSLGIPAPPQPSEQHPDEARDARRARRARPAPGHDPRAPDAHLVEQQQQEDPDEHRHRVRRRQQGGGDGGHGHRVAAVASEELRRHESQGGEDHDHQRELHGEPDGDHEPRREPEILARRDDRRERLLLKAEQHAQDVRQHPLVRDAGPGQEQQHADRERGHDQALLTVVQRRRQERPGLIDHDR